MIFLHFQDDNEIDFGQSDEIDFGTDTIDLDVDNLTTGDIDWGDLSSNDMSAVDIDWGVDVVGF